jgi:hypothetical protein
MKRWMMVVSMVALCASFLATAEEAPLVVQTGEAEYSASLRAALDEAIQVLERVLRDADLGSQKGLGQNGWDAVDFAAYTAGALERHGYRTAIVRRNDGTAEGRVWVLVGLELPGATVWVPVEPLPDPSRRQSTLGVIPTVETPGGELRFDERYVAYDSIVQLVPNVPPVAVIRPPAQPIEENTATAWFGHTSFDPDGEIVSYQWTFGGDEAQTTISSSTWHTFPAIGIYTVVLTVTDSRGAQSSTSLNVEVVEESEDCGCGG